MRKALLCILTMVISFGAIRISAQGTTTVADGTATNTLVPIYGFYADAYLRSQTIYPSPMLSGMVGHNITSMTFYLSSAPENDWGCPFVFQLATTSSNNFSTSNTFIETDFTQVYSGLVTISNNQMTINFTTPFVYTGGNLLLDVSNTSPGTYSSATFYGLSTQANFSLRGYSFSSTSSISNSSGQMFIPKVTFTHTAGTITCLPPRNLIVSGINAHGATLSWTPLGEQNSWQVLCDTGIVDLDQASWITVTDTFHTFTGLDANTEYNAYIRTNCGDHQSVHLLKKFWTSLIPVELPFTCDFENENVNSTIAIRNGSENNKWHIGSSVNQTPNGEKALYISADNGLSNTYNRDAASSVWAFFDVNFPTANEFLLSFDWRAYGEGNEYTSYDFLKVFVGPPANVEAGSFNAPTDATEIGLYYLNGSWQTANAILTNNFSNAIQRVYFLWRNDNSLGTNPPAAIDNITLTATNCRRPDSLVISNITTTSATVDIFPPIGSNEGWEIVCTNNTSAPIIINTHNSTGNLIENLNPSDYYTIYARAICDAGDTSNWSTTQTFHTECDTSLSVPRFWGFEEDWEPSNDFGQENTAPLCWHVYNGGTANSNYNWNWQHSSENAFAHSGNGSAMCYTDYATAAHNDWLITPKIALTGSQMLSFYAQRYNATVNEPEEISVWISDENITLTAPANDTDSLPGFTKLFQTLIPQGEYQLYEVPLTNYSGNRYIAFVRRDSPYDGYYLRLDDVTIDEMPSCSRPDNLRVEDISTQEVTIAWSASENPVNVYYKPENTPVFILANNSPVSDSSFTLTGLNSNTSYNIYVACICDDGTEQATQTISITTNCMAVVVTETEPFMENFNTLTSGIPDCWNNREGSTTSESYKWNYNFNGQTGACVRFDSYVNSSGNTNFLKTPVLNLSAIVSPTLSFSYKNPSGGDFSVYLSTDGGLTYPTAIATNLVSASEWTEVDYALSNINDGENVVIVFKGTSNYGTGDAFIYLDNVSVSSGNSCAKPSTLQVSEITNNSIGITWQEVGTASSWNVAYGPSGFTFSDSTVIVNSTDTSLTIYNLTTGQGYDFYVQSVCDEGVSTWRGPITAIPGIYIFDRIGNRSITTCGITVYDDGGPNGNYSSSSSYTLTIYPTETDSMVSVSGTFAGETNLDYLSIYDGTSASEESLLMKIYSSMVGVSGSQVTFGPLTSDSGPLTLYFFSDPSVSYAGFEVHVSCVAAPNCHKPHELTVSNLTSSEASISWVNLSENVINELYYKQHDDSIYTVVPSSALTDGSSYQLTGLTSATTYDLFVVSLCDGDTMASNIITFTTFCETFNDYPFIETFEDNSTSFNCWTIIDANNDGKTFTRSTGNIHYPWHSSNSANDWLLSPSFVLDGRQTVEIEYWSSSFEEKFQVFAIRDDGTETALTQIISVQTDATQNLSIDLYDLIGTYRIGFHCISDADMFNLYFDNFRLYNTQLAVLAVEPASMSFQTIVGIASSTQTATLSGISLNNNITVTATAPFEISTDGADFSATTTITVDTTDIEENLFVRYNPSTAGTHNGNVVFSCGNLSDTIMLTGTALDCSARTLPYTENFDNYTGGISSDTETPANYPDVDMPQCWLFPNRSESANDYPIVFLSSSSNYAVSGNCLFFKSSSTTPAYAVLPDFASAIQNLQMYFTYRNQGTSNYNGTLAVGYMTDASDVSTFVEIATYTRTTTLSEEFVRFDLVPSSVTNANIAFRYTGGISDNYFLSIDNVEVEEFVPCDEPSGLTVDNITTSSATISWTANGNANSWNVQYKLQSASQWQEANVQQPTCEIEGLTAASEYDVRVKAICSDDNQSDFVSTTFTTQTVGIDNITLANSIRLMPNPADDYIELSVNSNVNVKEAVVYNAFGQMIQTVQLNGNHARINLSGMSAGMYFVRINDNNMTATKKFIKR